MAEIITYKRKLCLLRIDLFDLADAFNGLMLKYVATQSVNGISWVNNYPT